MRIGVDFDKTIFDTPAFYTCIEDIVEVSIERFKDTFEALYNEKGDVTAEDHAEKLLPEAGKEDVEELADAIRTAYEAAPEYLHTEVLELLQEIRQAHEVVIITRKSHDGWQQKKVHESGAEKYVDDVIVVSGEAADTPKDAVDVLIDDSEHEEVALKTAETQCYRLENIGKKYSISTAKKVLKEVIEQ